MINQYRGIVIAILIFSCVILVGIGHGGVPIIMIEVGLPFLKELKFSFDPTDSFKDTIAAGALFLLIGQLLLFISTHKLNLLMRLIAISIMWIGFYYLVHNIFANEGSGFTFATGSPFLILSMVLFSFDIRQYLQRNKTDSDLE
ncbi:hypothetical protein AAFN85_08240 [Mucilaginibacter sp. CAU 1740]|uniref:hypothetical protein n=1 Tax=Mucilaginibacter sp. CAU 1740 TaxID=3140365 RepID=UPI00325A63C9